jgi:adenine-specific DNA-methyltransferase
MATTPKTAKNGTGTRTKDVENLARDYRFRGTKRKNNPPAKIAAEGTVPLLPKSAYQYNPRLAPALRFDPTGRPDKLPELLQESIRRPLTRSEAKELMTALHNQEPWLEWAGKREKHRFEVDPVALHIHERISAQAVLKVAARQDVPRSLFADPEQDYHHAVQFYRYDIDWTNRLILGDSLLVMNSLARREDLAGKIQMIYMDPPYGIKFASNFQPEVGRTTVKETEENLTREPEMVKAYRDTWHLGVHSYLSYLRDRLIVARDLLTEEGSIFVQIGDENLHLVRATLDEVFQPENFVAFIAVKKKKMPLRETYLFTMCDYLLWYAKSRDSLKFRKLFLPRDSSEQGDFQYVETAEGAVISIGQNAGDHNSRQFQSMDMRSSGRTESCVFPFEYEGKTFNASGGRSWKTNLEGMKRLAEANRLFAPGDSLRYKLCLADYPVQELSHMWMDTQGATDKDYVVQTATKVIERCLLMTTDPGDLVLDPTCGSGTTAFVAEQWGRRWITIDTSRVAIAVARQRILTQCRFAYYKLRPIDDEDRRQNPQGTWLTDPSGEIDGPCTFTLKHVPHITIKSIAQNPHLDPIFAKHNLDEALRECNIALSTVSDAVRRKLAQKLIQKQKDEGIRAISDADRRRWLLPASWEHYNLPFDADQDYPETLRLAITSYRKAWRLKMAEVNSCIAANAESLELVDDPETLRGIVRVSGPFTVEAVQPPEMSLGQTHVVQDESEFGGAPESLETFPPVAVTEVESRAELEARNVEAYLDQMTRLLKMDGVRFPKNKQMNFQRLEPVLDGSVMHAEGRWFNGEKDKDPEGKANIGVVFGPQYGPVTALQVEDAVRQASRRGYDHLVIAGFSFDGAAQAVIEEAQHPKLKIHAAHIRPDVNPAMNGLLKEQAGSQLFTVFGQPRTKIDGPDAQGEYVVIMEGVDIYNPVDNSITPTKADKVAAWFLDGDYDGRTFCITQAFFPDKDAWGKLSKALDGIVDPERFEALSGTKSLPFPPGKHKTVAVKVIDPRGNEVMSVHKLDGRRA